MIASALCCDLCPNVFIADKPGTNSYLTIEGKSRHLGPTN